MPSSSIVQPVDSTSLVRPKWNERRQLWQRFLPLPSECWLLHPQQRYLWVILILSISIAVKTSEKSSSSSFHSKWIVSAWSAAALARIFWTCSCSHLTSTTLAHFVALPLVIRGVFEFTFLWLDRKTIGKSPPSIRVIRMRSLHLVTKKELQTPTQNLIFTRCHFKDSIIVNSFRKNTIRPTEDNSTVGFVYQTMGCLRITSQPHLEKSKSLAWKQIWIWIH